MHNIMINQAGKIIFITESAIPAVSAFLTCHRKGAHQLQHKYALMNVSQNPNSSLGNLLGLVKVKDF